VAATAPTTAARSRSAGEGRTPRAGRSSIRTVFQIVISAMTKFLSSER
jgi:hypothetical protein